MGELSFFSQQQAFEHELDGGSVVGAATAVPSVCDLVGEGIMKLLLLVCLPFLVIAACGSSESERLGESLDPSEVEEVVKTCVDEAVGASEGLLTESDVTLYCDQVTECLLEIVSDEVSPIFDCIREAYADNLEVLEELYESESSEDSIDDFDAEEVVKACVDEATSSSDFVLTEAEAALYCEQFLECLYGEDYDLVDLLVDLEASTIFDCTEELTETLLEQFQERN